MSELHQFYTDKLWICVAVWFVCALEPFYFRMVQLQTNYPSLGLGVPFHGRATVGLIVRRR